MSINDPLLKELKSFASCLLRNGGKSVTDNNETLYPFCMCVETVLQRGLSYIHGPFGLIKTPQSWTWLEQIAQRYPGAPYSYVSSVNEVRNSKKVTTPVGKLRLLIRVCLVRKCLHVPVELIVRHHAAAGVYTTGSILSDEIRGEILLSTLMPCSLLNFNLDLDNSSFLDHTWVLPSCITTEFVPCKALGLTLNFVDGRALIMHVKEGSVSAENGLIKTGDILDELNGVHVTNSTRKKLASIMRKSTAKPITVRIIKAFLHEPDIIYPPILTLLLQAHLDPNELVRLHKENALGQSLTKQVSQDAPSPGIPVMYVGAIETGSKGDVKQIMPAIARILKERDCKKKLVVIEILEIGIRVLDEASGIVLQNPSYMEISSCGLTIHFPNYFAYISGFSDFHVASSVCTPSRGALLTGRLGLRTGVVKHLTPDAVGGIAENETTLAEILSHAGYRTGMFGKWHLGTQSGHHPLDKGLQTYLGIPYSVDMGRADPPGANYPPCPACPSENSSRLIPFPMCNVQLALPLYSNRTIIHEPAKLEELSAMFADFAEEFISQRVEPFFLYAALQHVHAPLAHGPICNNITGKGTFADTLLEMDWLVGRVVQAAMNHSENTLIWVLSDNGPWEVKCALAGSCGPFTGKWQRDEQGGGGGGAEKNTVWECGHRVPSLVLWPGHVKPGSVSDALVSSLDIMPTIAAILNISLPSDRFYDGMNIQDILTGQSSVGHEVLFHPNSGLAGPDGEIGAVRIGDYKVVYYTGGTLDCDYKIGPVMSHFSSPFVFNIKNDPEESISLGVNTTEWLSAVQAAEEALAWLEMSRCPWD